MMATTMTSLSEVLRTHGYCIKIGRQSHLARDVPHDGLGILFVREGMCRFTIGNWTATLPAHTGILFDNRIRHTAKYGNRQTKRTVVHLAREILPASSFERLLGDNGAHSDGPGAQGFRFPTPEAETRFHWAVSHLGSLVERPTSRDAARHLVGLILSEMKPCDLQNVLPPLLENAIQFMKRHLDSDYTIADVAEKVYCSESHLRRLFDQLLGVSPHGYWQNLRIDHARQLLGEGATIAEAARATGFSSRRGFEKAFSRSVGMSPYSFARMSASLRSS